jgi:hypothetical protein
MQRLYCNSATGNASVSPLAAGKLDVLEVPVFEVGGVLEAEPRRRSKPMCAVPYRKRTEKPRAGKGELIRLDTVADKARR